MRWPDHAPYPPVLTLIIGRRFGAFQHWHGYTFRHLTFWMGFHKLEQVKNEVSCQLPVCRLLST